MVSVISTFAGCGGSSLGYKWTGYDELLAVDFDRLACECFGLNFPAPIWCRDIREIKAEEILEFCGLDRGELDLLDGSPPCQGFSAAGKRRVSDDRNSLFREFCRLLDGLRPKAFVMENVAAAAWGRMRGVFMEMMGALEGCGYTVKCKMLNAKYYGVPQSRARLFWVGVRGDLKVESQYPEPSNRIRTVKWALEQVVEDSDREVVIPSEGIQQLVRQMRQGERAAKYDPRNFGYDPEGNWGWAESRYGRDLYRLDLSRPAPTVRAMIYKGWTGAIHPLENRFLTIQELKAICSFPQDFKLTGNFQERWRLLGNAVMPRQMEAVARTVKEKILDA